MKEPSEEQVDRLVAAVEAQAKRRRLPRRVTKLVDIWCRNKARRDRRKAWK